ncbi:MAG: hypothetical protein ACE5GV_17505 [Candidatus Scalindua sp.]
MKFANYDKNRALRIYQLRIAKVELKHREELLALNKRLSKSGLISSGEGFNEFNDLAKQHIQEKSEIFADSNLDAIQSGKVISEDTKSEVKKVLHSFVDVRLAEENMAVRQRLARYNETGSLVETFLNDLAREAGSIKNYLENKIDEEINKRNETLKRESEGRPTLTDKIINKIKNNKVISAFIVIGILIIALGKVTDSLNKIQSFLSKNNSSNTIVAQELMVFLKVRNKGATTLNLSPYCNYEITEDMGTTIVNHSNGRLHLTLSDSSNSVNSYAIHQNETKSYVAEFPNPNLYSALLDRGAANLHIILRPIEGSDFWLESIPFDRASLRKYSLFFEIDTIEKR